MFRHTCSFYLSNKITAGAAILELQTLRGNIGFQITTLFSIKIITTTTTKKTGSFLNILHLIQLDKDLEPMASLVLLGDSDIFQKTGLPF